MNISNFMSWFIQQFINIASNMINKIDQIILYGNVTLLDFTITIAIIGAFVGILITVASTKAVGKVSRSERRRNDKQ